MSALPPIKRFVLEDFAGVKEIPDFCSKFFYPLNLFLTSTYSALNNGVTIAANTTNKLAFALGGIVASAKLFATSPSCLVPTGTIIPVTLQAFDAAGQVIVGSEPYVDTMGNPLSFTLVNTDASTNTHVVAGPPITTPQGAASIQYTGGIANPMLSASIAGGSVGGGVTPRSFTINCT